MPAVRTIRFERSGRTISPGYRKLTTPLNRSSYGAPVVLSNDLTSLHMQPLVEGGIVALGEPAGSQLLYLDGIGGTQLLETLSPAHPLSALVAAPGAEHAAVVSGSASGQLVTVTGPSTPAATFSMPAGTVSPAMAFLSTGEIIVARTGAGGTTSLVRLDPASSGASTIHVSQDRFLFY